MCRVHIERYHWLCAHCTWLTSHEDNGSCGVCSEQQAYRLEVWYNLVCPLCQAFGFDGHPAIRKHNLDGIPFIHRVGEDKERLRGYQNALYRRGMLAELARTDLCRRVHIYRRAVALYQRARTAPTFGSFRKKLPSELEGVCTEAVPRGSLPMGFQPKTHLQDGSDFFSPDIIIVPPGMVPEGRERCGVCWGDLSLTDDGGCEGGWPRMLECGHIYGKLCLEEILERYGCCPLCTRQYRVSRQMPPENSLPAVSKAIDGLIADLQLDPRWELARYILLRLFAPIVLAAVLTTDIGPRLDGDRNLRRANLPTKIVIWVVCILLSPAMYAYIIWQTLTELRG